MKVVGKAGTKKFKAKAKALMIYFRKYGYKLEGTWFAPCQACGRLMSLKTADPMHKIGAGSKWRMAEDVFDRVDAEKPENIAAGHRVCHGIIDNTPAMRVELEKSPVNVITGGIIEWTRNHLIVLEMMIRDHTALQNRM